MKYVKLTRKDGNTAAINPALVRYVFQDPSKGTYIAFEEEHSPETPHVTPIGLEVCQPVESVIKGMNRSYYFDLIFRFAGFVIPAIAAAAAAWLFAM